MHALQFLEPDKYAVSAIGVPEINDDEVLVASRSVGVCHSDLDLLAGRYIIPFKYPIIPGHEWSGQVMAVGKKVTQWAPGDRVVGECVIGVEHFGFSISGAAAEYFVCKDSWLHRIPDDLSWTQGALVEPFSCGYYATLRAGNLDASDHVVVLGAGPIGLGTIAAAAAKGAHVTVIEPSEQRRALAASVGAESAIHPFEVDPAEAVKELTKGRGASVVFEATGKLKAMATALEVAAFRARLVYIGIDVGGTGEASLGLIQSKELDIKGSIGSPGVWPQTIAFLSRTKIDLSPMVTTRFALENADQAMATVMSDHSQVKIHMTSDAR
jgi:L-iditol 2-dehydrogenase